MAHRRKNPSPLTMLLVAGAAALGGYGIYRVFSAPKKAAAKKQVAPKEQQKKKTQGKYVGTGWTGWPHKDLFKNERSFGDVVLALGYAVGAKLPDESGWSPRDPGFIAAVKDFQGDYNTVLAYVVGKIEEGDEDAMFLLFADDPRLTVDGKIGRSTADALYKAYNIGQDHWQALVDRARAYKGPTS